MKKRYIISLLLLFLFTTTACKNDNTDLEKIVSNISLSGNLVTNKVYYHNVAEYDGSKANFLLRLFGIDKKIWIEYTGLTDLSIELSRVKTSVHGNKIHVFIPKTKVSKCYAKNDGPDDIVFYGSDGSIFNLGSVSTSEGSEALALAQTVMCDAVKNDKELLRKAQKRAESLIKEKIKAFTEESDSSYSIEWEYEENNYDEEKH